MAPAARAWCAKNAHEEPASALKAGGRECWVGAGRQGPRTSGREAARAGRGTPADSAPRQRCSAARRDSAELLARNRQRGGGSKAVAACWQCPPLRVHGSAALRASAALLHGIARSFGAASRKEEPSAPTRSNQLQVLSTAGHPPSGSCSDAQSVRGQRYCTALVLRGHSSASCGRAERGREPTPQNRPSVPAALHAPCERAPRAYNVG